MFCVSNASASWTFCKSELHPVQPLNMVPMNILFYPNGWAGGIYLISLITDAYVFRSREVTDFHGEIRVDVTRGNIKQKPVLTHQKMPQTWVVVLYYYRKDGNYCHRGYSELPVYHFKEMKSGCVLNTPRK